MMQDREPIEELEDPRHLPGTAIWVLGGLFILMAAIGVYFREAEPTGAGVNVADVSRNPNEYLGRTVTVRGEVENVVGPNAFILEDEGPGGEMLVVKSASDAMPPAAKLEELDEVRIVGEVREFDPDKLQTEVGVPATDERLKSVQGKPVLYAFQVIVPPGKAEEHARSDTPQD